VDQKAASLGVGVVALKRNNLLISMIPDQATKIEGGDFLVMIGETQSLNRRAGG